MDAVKFFRNYNCWIKDNTFKFGNLTNQRLVPEFINSIKRLYYKFGHKKIILDFEEVGTVFPYPTAAIAGYIDYFFRNHEIEFELINTSRYLNHIHLNDPQSVDKKKVNRYKDCLDNIWKFHNSEEVNLLVNGILANIRRTMECEPGVLDACTWGLNETMDNVIQHAETNCGFAMATIHKKTKNINVCIFDYGIGIYRSFKNSENEYNPRSAADAISLAIQEGTTRNKSVGQGNGLWGLYNIVNLNSGHMGIISGKGGLSLNKGNMKTFKEIIVLSKDQQATTVNFHLNLNNDISIKEALGGEELIDLYIEEMEDEHDRLIFRIADTASGTGTRESGLKIKNEVINLYKKAKKTIIIDFADVGIISSSFADEFIGKLVAELGFYQFQSIFTLINMNTTIQAIVQRALSQRVAETLKNSKEKNT